MRDQNYSPENGNQEQNNVFEYLLQSPLQKKKQKEKEKKYIPKFEIQNFSQESDAKAQNQLIYGTQVELYFKLPAKIGQENLQYLKGYLYQFSQDELIFCDEYNTCTELINIFTISNISSLKPQWKTMKQRQLKNLNKIENEQILVVNYETLKNEVLILFQKQLERNLFWQGLQSLILKQLQKKNDHSTNESIQSLFSEIEHEYHDHASQFLYIREVHDFIKRANIQMCNLQFRYLFLQFSQRNQHQNINQINKQQQQSAAQQPPNINEIKFNKHDTKQFITEQLYKKELIQIFEKYAQTSMSDIYIQIMTQEQFYNFLIKEQMEDHYLKNCKELVPKVFLQLSPDNNEKISFQQFSSYIFSTLNEAFNPLFYQIYQKMDQPITDYYINSARQIFSFNIDIKQIYDLSPETIEQWECQHDSKYLPLLFALSRGVRFLEIEVWEGEFEVVLNNVKNSIIEPCLFYGPTMNSKLAFSDFLKKLKQNVFKENIFPFILQIESHCSNEINDKIELYLTNILENLLYKIPHNYQHLNTYPTVLELVNKILITGKIKKSVLDEQENFKIVDIKTTQNFFQFDQEIAQMMGQDESFDNQKSHNIVDFIDSKNLLQKPKLKSFLETKIQFQTEESKSNNQQFKFDNPVSHTQASNYKEITQGQNNISNNNENQDQIKQKNNKHDRNTDLNQINVEIQPENQNLSMKQEQNLKNNAQLKQNAQENQTTKVQNLQKYLKADGLIKHFSLYCIQFQNTINPSMFELYTLTNKEVKMFIENESVKKFNNSAANFYSDISLFSRNYLMRIEPSGKKIDQNNFDPVQMGFKSGAQIVLNHPQTFDIHSLVYFSKFHENGYYHCGYIQKPLEYRNSNGPQQRSSGFNLQINLLSGYQIQTKSGDTTISPYVEIMINQPDIAETTLYKTEEKFNNTYNPYWNFSFKIYIEQPEISFLIFQVINKSNNNKILLGWNSIPINCIREGFRSVPLRDQHFNIIKQSYLLCQFKKVK